MALSKDDVKYKVAPRHFNSVTDYQAVKCYNCEHFAYQEDWNGEIVISFCSHPENSNPYEGNTNGVDCPLVQDIRIVK